MILSFPYVRRAEGPTSQDASWRQKGSLLVREGIGRFLNWIGVPGTVSNARLHDDVTGQEIEILVNALFTRISINGRDHYFHRFNGKYDGSGSGCR